MLNSKQPSPLVICALNRLVKLVHFDNGPFVFTNYSHSTLQEFFSSIPSNLFDQWAEELLLASNQFKIKSDSHLLVFGPALTKLNVDDFPTLPVDVFTLSECLKLSKNIKSLCCRYTPYFWSPSDLFMFQNSLVALKNLQTLVMCNINLVENPNFLQVVGTSCQQIVELDMSYAKIPVSNYQVLCQHFPCLEVLRIKQRSEEYRTFTQTEGSLLLTSLLKLKILDDDTTNWSCIYPAMRQLSIKDTSGDLACANLRQLAIYHIYPSGIVKQKFTKMITNVLLDSKIFKQLTIGNQTIADWILDSFPSLLSIDLRLDNVWFPRVQPFLQTEAVGWKIHSIVLSNIPLNIRHFQTIGKHVTNLKRFEVINRRTLDTDAMMEGVVDFVDEPDVPGQLYNSLAYLSFTGMWNESISSLLLNHSFSLQELKLKTYTLHTEFIRFNRLDNLQRLLLDVSYITCEMSVYELEKDFLRQVLPSASKSLKNIRLKSRPPEEWQSLAQVFKVANCDWKMLKPI